MMACFGVVEVTPLPCKKPLKINRKIKYLSKAYAEEIA
jgi:hypothetical protein